MTFLNLWDAILAGRQEKVILVLVQNSFREGKLFLVSERLFLVCEKLFLFLPETILQKLVSADS